MEGLKQSFDRVINRKGTHSLKWDALEKRYGSDELLPMWVADMDFQAPQEVLDVLQEKIDHGILGYPTHSEEVDKAIYSWLKRRYDWEIAEDSLLYTAGVVPAISYIIQAFSEPGDEVIIQTPVYYPFYNVVKNNKRELICNRLSFDGDHYEMDLKQLEESITDKTKILLLCHPHNPVCRVWTREELEALAEICKKHDLYVISDEIHADLLFDGYKHIPFASLNEDTAMRTFTCLAPTKTFNLAGIQTSYIVTQNKTLHEKLENHLANSFANMTNVFAEAATTAAYTHGEQWLEELMSYVQMNYELVKEYVAAHMPILRVMDSEGTYLLWLDCSKLPLTPAERKKWLIEEAKVALNHGAMFGEEGKNFERINLATPRETLVQGLERIRAAYEKSGF